MKFLATGYKLLASRLEQWLWWVFVATFAWQTRVIVWQADRTFIEWRAAFIYFSDILMVGLFVAALWHIVRTRAWRIRPRRDVSDIVLLVFLIFALLTVHNTDHVAVSAYQWFRLMQFVLFYFYVRYRASSFSSDGTALALVVGGLSQSFLAIGQYILQHDVGIRWIGETLLNTQMKGVAVFYDLSHIKILRAYGTLPHPNVLAAYLMIALWALMYLYLRHGRGHARYDRWIWVAAGVPMLWALYMTYSRTMVAIWLVATAVMAIVLWHKRFAERWANIAVIRRRAREMIIVLLVASTVFGGLFWRQAVARALISTHEEAVQLRIYYAKEAIGSGGHSWLALNWTGVGVGNFVGWLRRADASQPFWVYQPAHNLYLLVYTETGIIGVGLFGAWLALIFRSALRQRHGLERWGMIAIFTSFLLIALFDHFFWTLQQGRILFWGVLAFIASREQS